MGRIVKAMTFAAILALALALTGCGGQDSQASSDTAASGAGAISEAVESASSGEDADDAGQGADEAAAASDLAAEDADTYENEFFAISFELPEGWAFVSESELAAQSVESGAIAADAGIDALAVSEDGSMQVLIAYERATDGNAGQTAEQHLANSIEQSKAGIEQNDNYEYTSSDVSFDFESGRSIPLTLMDITVDGASATVGQACVEREGNFLDITVVGPDADTVAEIFSYLKSME